MHTVAEFLAELNRANCDVAGKDKEI